MLNEILSVVKEKKFSYCVLGSCSETIVCFYNPRRSKTTIYLISYSKDCSYIDMGNIMSMSNDIILGYSHRLTITSNMGIVFEKTVRELNEYIEMSSPSLCLDKNMEFCHEFSNAEQIIGRIVSERGYKVIEKLIK